MKILVIGDFHGKFTNKKISKLKRKQFDMILSVGDFCGNAKWSKIFFKHFYAKNKKEVRKIPKIIKDELKSLERDSLEKGIWVLNKIKIFSKPFFAVHGNWDPVPWGNDVARTPDEIEPKSFLKKFHKIEKKDFEFVDFKVKDFKDFVLVGGTSSSYPGKKDKRSLKRVCNKKNIKDLNEAMELVKAIKKNYSWREKKYIYAFKKAKKLNKPIIFLTHNCPYGSKLDIIKHKKAHKLIRGEHYGSYLDRLMINRFKPDLVLCGHIHENFGKQKLGKSLIVNTGAIFQGEYVMIDFNEKTKKFKVRLKRLK